MSDISDEGDRGGPVSGAEGRARPIGAAGMRALGSPVRRSIIDLLGDRPATVTELATALDKAKGTIAHHVDVLVDAGLVEVVATRRVRAVEERTYGRTAPTFLLPEQHRLGNLSPRTDAWMVDEAVASARPARSGEAALASVRFARFSHERAAEFEQRLADLVDEFAVAERGGDVVYGMLVALFPTDRPHLPDPTTEDPHGNSS